LKFLSLSFAPVLRPPIESTRLAGHMLLVPAPANRGYISSREVLCADRCARRYLFKGCGSRQDILQEHIGISLGGPGHGWLIFALPAAEVAFHLQDDNDKHEMYFTCDDIKTQVADLRKKGVQVGEMFEEQWGTRTTITLPGGGNIGLYQPKHPLTFKTNYTKKKSETETTAKER